MNQRRHARVRYRARFCLLWDEQAFKPRYVKAVSRDLSDRGLCLETSEAIPVGTFVSLRAVTGELLGSARIKHATRRGSIYILGIEFGYSLLDEARLLVREVYNQPLLSRAPVRNKRFLHGSNRHASSPPAPASAQKNANV
jgi:hypothetical protein